jgi:2-polyprenyl-3-methyl-5-hydroxy-6-metoxy-1,4-benzoquinol methylase
MSTRRTERNSPYNLFGKEYADQRLSGGMLFNDYIEAPVVRGLLSRAAMSSGSRALDIGCGPGIYTRAILELGASVTAIDSSAVMLQAARNHCSTIPNIANLCTFVQQPFEDFDLHNQSFHLILATFMLSYFEDLQATLSRMRRALTSEGRIITSMLHPVRMFATDRTRDGYITGDYFQGGHYTADFLDQSSPLQLRRYNFEQIHDCANNAGLSITQLLEPSADVNCTFHDREKVRFYSHNPSILVLEMKSK